MKSVVISLLLFLLSILFLFTFPYRQVLSRPTDGKSRPELYNEGNPSFPSVAAVVEKWMNETEITCLIDIGANVGAITSLGASRNKTVIAVEPLPINLAKLYKLIQDKKWEDRVHVLPYAMSDNRTFVQMTNELKNNYQTTYIKHKDNKPGIPNLDGTLDIYAITLALCSQMQTNFNKNRRSRARMLCFQRWP